jgi:hypothetical protein
MPKFSNLLAEKAKGEFQVGGSTVTFVYYPVVRQRFNEDEWNALLGVKGRDYLKMLLPRVVESWDITDDDEHAIPVTAEAFDQYGIPDVMLIAIERRIWAGDLSGKVPTPTTLTTSSG